MVKGGKLMHTKIENGMIVLGNNTTAILNEHLEELKKEYQHLDVNVSPELRREYEEVLFALRRRIQSAGIILRRKLRYHGRLLEKYEKRPRWWPRRESSGENIHESDFYMREIKDLEFDIERRYCEIKMLRCRRQCLVRALKRY